MPQIFLSYRRSDSAYVAATLSNKLQEHFGENAVFFDVDTIPLGVDFREFIGNAVGECDVLLAIIGDQWVRAVDARGNRRIDDPSDFVRIEIESALKRNIPVIPVLVDEVKMPAAEDLPPSLQSIVYRNATELRAGRDLDQHLELLVRGLDSLLKPKNVADAKVTAAPQPVHDTTSALDEIKNSLEGFTNGNVFVGTIPPKKLKNAIGSYATEVSPEDVLLLYDNTVFGSAKEGLILTPDAVYWRNEDEPERLRYSEIRKVDVLKYAVAAGVVLNEKEVKIEVTGDNDNVADALAKVIRRLTSG